MKQKEEAPFHRCLVDHRSLHYSPTTKASKPYSQQTLEFHIRDDGTPDGACKFGRLCCAPGLHFAQQSISHGCGTSALPPSGGPCQGSGCWQLQPHPSCLPWRCARADGTPLSSVGHRTPLMFCHSFPPAVSPGRDFELCCISMIQHCDGKCRVN